MKQLIIGLVGKKQSGKDTVCGIIKDILGQKKVARIGFADSVKEDISRALNVSVDYIEKHKGQFRLILQGYGTDYVRALIPDFWIDRMQMALNSLTDNVEVLIIPDVRFHNESDYIKSKDGILVAVVRNGLPNDNHISETELLSIKPNFKIDNTLDLEFLREQTKQLLQQLNLI